MIRAIAAAAIGLWLMAAPAVLDYSGAAATSDRIAGPIAATFAIVAWWEATRGVLRVEVAIGAWLVLAPWVLGGYEPAAAVQSVIAGFALIACGWRKPAIEGRYGGGWAALWRGDRNGASLDA